LALAPSKIKCIDSKVNVHILAEVLYPVVNSVSQLQDMVPFFLSTGLRTP
jgi:hypothetical protein